MTIFNAVRRRLLTGMAGAGAAMAAGAESTRAADEPEAFGPAQTLELGAVDFQPRDSSGAYYYVPPGGVVVTDGEIFFASGLRLPSGTRVVGAGIYLNSNGNIRKVFLSRNRPLNPAIDNLATESSTSAMEVQAIPMRVSHVMAPGWNYSLGTFLPTGGVVLYGGWVRYRPVKR